MAIVCSQSGQYYDVPDEELAKYSKKPEELSKDVTGRSAEDCGPGGSCGQGGPGGGGPGGPGGFGGGSSPIQIIVNYIQGGHGPSGGGAPSGQGGGAPKGQDVGGRYCGWHNCWRNCWRNWHHGWRH